MHITREAIKGFHSLANWARLNNPRIVGWHTHRRTKKAGSDMAKTQPLSISSWEILGAKQLEKKH